MGAPASIQTLLSGAGDAPAYERSAFGALSSFAVTIAIARAAASLKEREQPATRPRALLRRAWRTPGGSHVRVHHFVPGTALAFVGGGAAILRSGDLLGIGLSMVWGTGTALALDEIEVVLRRRDAYWRSKPLALAEAGSAAVGAAVLATRFHRRGSSRE